jgi:hypothetical protein
MVPKKPKETDSPCLKLVQREAAAMAKINAKQPTVGSYKSVAEFLLKHGCRFAPSPYPGHLPPPGRLKECYHNAGILAVTEGLAYCEGYAAAKNLTTPVAHAWCLDLEGNVVEPTWPDGFARDYFGVAFKVAYVKQCAANREEFGILETDYLEDFKTLRSRPALWKFQITKGRRAA